MKRLLFSVLFVLLMCAGRLRAADSAYDPLKEPDGFTPQTLDLVVHDPDGPRDIPVLIYLPTDKSPAAVVLFSHGLGGSRQGCAYLGKHWSARGYVAVFLQHPGSDTSIWQDKPVEERRAALRDAVNVENFLLRVKDVPAVLDQLDKWSKAAGDPLFGRLDLTRIGMSGHSFGAVTTQAVSGESFPAGGTGYTDPRIKAAVCLSPSGPSNGGDPKAAFGDVKIPWMLMTGTDDVAPIGNATVASRLAVYPALPPGGKYELVLDGAEHSAFTESALPGDHQPRNPNHHRVILALSTAFWDAWLRDDKAAKAWLDGDGPATVLQPKDHWQHK